MVYSLLFRAVAPASHAGRRGRGRVSEFRTIAGNGSCIVGRLGPSLTVMSRGGQKFLASEEKQENDNAETRGAAGVRSRRTAGSSADRGAQGVGEGLGKALDIRVVF